MAKTLEELLKAEGYTDADLEAVKPLLTDAKFRGTLERQLGALETTLAEYKTENEGWSKFYEETTKPLIAQYDKDIADAKAAEASLAARLKLAEQQGYAPKRDEPQPQPQPQATGQPAPFDPKAHKLVTQDDIAKYADMEGEAIAIAANLAEEYRILTNGKSIYEYQTTTQDGRTLNGMVALRHEAKANKKPMAQFVAEKFDFQGKRNTMAEAARLKAEQAIREDERNKVISQYGDPNARPLMPSKDPFIPRPREDRAGKQPWEIPAQERAKARIERAMQTQMKASVQ